MRLAQPAYLAEQYRNGSNLNARIQLHARFSTNHYGLHRWVFDQLDLAPESRILELGCGTAALWRENLDRLPAGWEVMFSDLSPGMVQEARRSLASCQQALAFAVIDAQAIPFREASSDGVIANHMLYHVPDRRKALAEIRRVLKPGGRFYASTIGRAHLRELGDLVDRFLPEGEHWGVSTAEGFLLENAAEQLAPWFSDVRLGRYEDSLLITEARPLIAYVLSDAKSLTGERLAAFVQEVERELATHSAIHISKDSGILTGVRSG